MLITDVWNNFAVGSDYAALFDIRVRFLLYADHTVRVSGKSSIGGSLDSYDIESVYFPAHSALEVFYDEMVR